MQVYEKYVNLARDAFSSGDRIAAESYQQYAEHYYRIINDTTDPQRPAPERSAQERPEAEQAAGDRSGAEQPPSGRQPYPVNAEQPFVDGSDRTPEAKSKSSKSTEAAGGDEAPAADSQSDGQSDGEAAPEKKAKPRGRGRPRTRAKAGNGAMADAESNPAGESSQPCEAGEATD